jgi:hypothetical protein
LNIGWRAADHAKDFTSRGLLFQRFAELLGPRLHLTKQANVLNCYDGLIGEGRNELDLLLAVRLRLAAL